MMCAVSPGVEPVGGQHPDGSLELVELAEDVVDDAEAQSAAVGAEGQESLLESGRAHPAAHVLVGAAVHALARAEPQLAAQPNAEAETKRPFYLFRKKAIDRKNK